MARQASSQAVSHQVVRLGRGRHGSPAAGVDAAGAYAAHAACSDDDDAHAQALLFLDELIAMGDDPSTHLLPLRFDVADVVPAPELMDKPAVSAAG